MKLVHFIRKLITNNTAATAIEYALIATLISVSILTAVQAVGTNVAASFNATASAMKK